MSEALRPVRIGVLVGNRGFFNPALALEGRRALLGVLKSRGVAFTILDEAVTASGAVETLADARKYAEHFRSFPVDGILVSLPNFGDELGIAEAISRADLRVPVLVHAFDDDPRSVDFEHRRDAFCGKLSVTNNLGQYGIAWTDTSEHTCAVDSPMFAADLDRFVQTCRVVRGLRGARIGAIGARPGAFHTVRFSEKLLQATGITVVTIDLSDILAAAASIGGAAVGDRVAAIRAYGRVAEGTPTEKLERLARLALAMERWLDDQGCAASAVQCWTSVQINWGCAACLPMSMMGDLGRMPSACEMDVAGAVSMLALSLASGEASGFLDWNNNYGDDPNRCVATHCSSLPAGFIGASPGIATLDVLGANLGRERCFGAVKGKVRAGPMTYFRMHTDDTAGRIRGYIGEGEFTDDPFPMDGGIAVCRIPGLRQLLTKIGRGGFEHHVAMVRGAWASAIHEAVTRYLGWEVDCHGRG